MLSSPLCITPISVNLNYPCSLKGKHGLVPPEGFPEFPLTPRIPQLFHTAITGACSGEMYHVPQQFSSQWLQEKNQDIFLNVFQTTILGEGYSYSLGQKELYSFFDATKEAIVFS